MKNFLFYSAGVKPPTSMVEMSRCHGWEGARRSLAGPATTFALDLDVSNRTSRIASDAKFGSSQTRLVVSNLVVCSFLCGSALLRLFVPFCALLHCFADLHLRSFAHIFVFLRPIAFRTTAFGKQWELQINL